MLKTRVIPCLLLKEGGLVKTIKFKHPSYVGDPVNAVKIYNEKEVDELLFLDIMATLERREPPLKMIAEIATECFMPFGYGGGLRSIEDIREIFRLGVEKVAINSYAVENPDFIHQVSEVFGNQSIIVSIDAKKNWLGRYEVFIEGGRRSTGLDPVRFATLMEKKGAGEILINSIDRDGTMSGYDLGLIKSISQAVTIPVIACGGAGTVEDFSAAVKKGGASAVAAGSKVVYQGRNRAVLINFPARDELERVFR
jgi:imidazole glycerol-phosphate synthase subunit HisF